MGMAIEKLLSRGRKGSSDRRSLLDAEERVRPALEMQADKVILPTDDDE